MPRSVLWLVSGALALAGSMTEATAQEACDRACLRTMLDEYLEAVVANDPGLENFNLSMVVARRVPLVDVEAQAVLAYAVFIRRPGSPTPRNAFSEWFFIDQDRIRTIYTAMFYPPPELAVPNWPPYDGHWPLPATIVPSAEPPRP